MKRDFMYGVLGLAVASYFIFRTHYGSKYTHKQFEISPLVYKPDILPLDTKKSVSTKIIPGSDSIVKEYTPKYTVEKSYSLDTYMELPLETDGKTAENEIYTDLEEVVADDSKFIKYIRFHCKKIRNPEKKFVHVGGFSFFKGITVASSKPVDTWNPHTGATEIYTGQAWSDSDQQILIFRFSEPVIVTRYQMKTSSESSDFDPVEWTLESSMNGTFWEILDRRLSQPIIERRKTLSYAIAN